MSAIKINKLRKKFGSVEVLKDINIDMHDGEFVILVGPSGCGKSTLLRTIAGLETISSGDIMIGENRVNDLAPKDRDISMVFQSYALYPHMSVERNMGFSLEVQKRPSHEIKEAVDKAAQVLGLSHLLKRKPKELSGGQRQRVAMGRAIVRKPKVFLFDEPLSNLDAQLRVQMRLEIKALHQKLATTIVYVTHDQVEAMTLADRIVVLNEGIIQQVGAPLEIYDNPANLFVASFMGAPSMNFFDAHIREVAGRKILISASGIELPLSDGYQHVTTGTPVTCGIRPEHCAISDHQTAGSLISTVSVVEPTGISEQLYFDFEGKSFCIYSMERTGLSNTDKIAFTLDKQKLHLFDPKTTLRIPSHSSAMKEVM
jgi:multiple sugar transport system ATP-binding protein